MSRDMIITTSWDDGHTLDLRVAELLGKYGLTGTFYAPRAAERGTMTVAQLRQLATHFEIGGHTLDHVALTGLTPNEAARQIGESKKWVEDLTGRACTMFCPPKGWFNRQHLDMIADAGYTAARTVEGFSIDLPRRCGDLLVMPTSLQAYPHEAGAYVRNIVKRGAGRNLWRYVRHGFAGDWTDILQSMLRHAAAHGGVVHLWGHSWELESQGQWARLDRVLGMLASYRHMATVATNGQICANLQNQQPALNAA